MDAKEKLKLDNKMKAKEEEVISGSNLNLNEEFNNLSKNETE